MPQPIVTCAADIYSLGAILFYLLTGRPPFVGPNVLHVIHQAAATPAPRLRSLAPSLDRDLETSVARCLESDPKARYQSAGALAEDLEHWLGTSRFGPGALEFLLADENGCDEIPLRRCCWHH